MASYEYDSQNEELHRIAGGTLYADLPIGFILPSFEDVAPVGFLKLTDTLANRTVSRTTYKELFDWATAKGLIGTGKPFGVGDGSTTFVIPDGREIAFKGIGENASGASHVKSGGLAVGEFIDDRLKTFKDGNGNTYGGARSCATGANGLVICNSNEASVALSGTGATTEVKALGCHYYIKAKNVGVPADFIKEVSKLNSYSTDEINTGRTWIDGKPIYRKSFSGTSIPSDKIIGSVTNCDGVVSILGTIKNSADGNWLPVSYSGVVYCLVRANNTVYLDGGNYTASKYLVTVEYTKTTS